MRSGYLRKNGVPYSENAAVTEYFDMAPFPGGGQVLMVTAIVDDPSGYGRIDRSDQGNVERIVEDRDAEPAELEIAEIGTSIYCFRQSLLAPSLRRLRPNNAKGEYYLTDVVEGLA